MPESSVLLACLVRQSTYSYPMIAYVDNSPETAQAMRAAQQGLYALQQVVGADRAESVSVRDSSVKFMLISDNSTRLRDYLGYLAWKSVTPQTLVHNRAIDPDVTIEQCFMRFMGVTPGDVLTWHGIFKDTAEDFELPPLDMYNLQELFRPSLLGDVVGFEIKQCREMRHTERHYDCAECRRRLPPMSAWVVFVSKYIPAMYDVQPPRPAHKSWVVDGWLCPDCGQTSTIPLFRVGMEP